jgi:hypothetical protein
LKTLTEIGASVPNLDEKRAAVFEKAKRLNMLDYFKLVYDAESWGDLQDEFRDLLAAAKNEKELDAFDELIEDSLRNPADNQPLLGG